LYQTGRAEQFNAVFVSLRSLSRLHSGARDAYTQLTLKMLDGLESQRRKRNRRKRERERERERERTRERECEIRRVRTQNQPKESKPKDTAHQKKLQRQAEKVCRQTLRKPTRRLLIMHRRRFLFYFIFATTAHSVEGKHEPILESGLAAIHLGVQPTRDDCRRRA